MNTLRTIVLLGFMTALLVAVGGVLGGKTGLIVGLIIGIATNFFAYWFSDKIAIQMARAVPVSREEAPELYEIVEGLCQKANIPMPQIYIAPDESPNAFATGRDPEHAAVAVTAGILRLVNRGELEAVLAHEIGHVINRDILITSIGAVLASVITFLAHWGYYLSPGDREERSVSPIAQIALMILAPIAAGLINLAISRSREYEADATGARICGHPERLASALQKLDQWSKQIPSGVNPALGNLYTVQPSPPDWITNLMSNHPPIPDRVNRLEEMAMKGGSL